MNTRRTKNVIAAQRGITMFEVLVTIGIITIWLLATAGVQSSSAKLNKTAQLRSEAVILASEIAERMESNSFAAVSGGYVCSGNCALDQDPATDCRTAACNPTALADFDLKEWGKRIAAMFGSTASATITMTGASPVVTYTVTINWRDRREKRTYSNSDAYDSISYTSTRLVLFDPAQATPLP